MKAAVIFISGPIGKFDDGNGNFEGITLVDIIAQVKFQQDQAGKEKITDYFFAIGSPGGYVTVGDDVYDYMNSLRNESEGVRIHTRSIGMVGSIATKLFLAPDPAKGETREVRMQDYFMIHNPYGGIEGDASDHEAYAEELKETENKLVKFYMSKTSITEDGIAPLMKAETKMTAEEAKALGFATKITSAVAAKIKLGPQKKFKKESTQLNDNIMSKLGEEIIAGIKALLPNSKDKGQKNLSLTLQDGSTVQIDAETEEAVVGATVTVLDSEDNSTVASAGDYPLNDGKVLVVDAAGKVVEVKAAPEETQEAKITRLEAELAKSKEENKALENKANVDKLVEEKVNEELQPVNEMVKELEAKAKTDNVKIAEVEKKEAQMKALCTIHKVDYETDFVALVAEETKPNRMDDAADRKKAYKKVGGKSKRGQVVAKH